MGCCSGRCTLAFICGMQLVSEERKKDVFVYFNNVVRVEQRTSPDSLPWLLHKEQRKG